MSGGGAVGEIDAGPAAPPRAARPLTTRRWLAFVALAAGIVVADQVVKAWIVGSFPFGSPVEVLGAWLRIWYVANNGAIFGLFRDQAVIFAVLSVAVMALIVGFHARTGPDGGWPMTLALGLLLGGAVGNFIDRVRLGYVIDFVDMGLPGGWRFYTWNVADAAITCSLALLLALAILPVGRRGPRSG